MLKKINLYTIRIFNYCLGADFTQNTPNILQYQKNENLSQSRPYNILGYDLNSKKDKKV